MHLIVRDPIKYQYKQRIITSKIDQTIESSKNAGLLELLPQCNVCQRFPKRLSCQDYSGKEERESIFKGMTPLEWKVIFTLIND